MGEGTCRCLPCFTDPRLSVKATCLSVPSPCVSNGFILARNGSVVKGFLKKDSVPGGRVPPVPGGGVFMRHRFDVPCLCINLLSTTVPPQRFPLYRERGGSRRSGKQRKPQVRPAYLRRRRGGAGGDSPRKSKLKSPLPRRGKSALRARVGGMGDMKVLRTLAPVAYPCPAPGGEDHLRRRRRFSDGWFHLPPAPPLSLAAPFPVEIGKLLVKREERLPGIP